MRKFIRTAAAAVIAALTAAVSLSFSACAEKNAAPLGENYEWQLKAALFAADKDGRVQVISKPDLNDDYDPARYAARLDELTFVCRTEATEDEAAKTYYCEGDALIAVWECDVGNYGNGRTLQKKYPDCVFFEATVWKNTAKLDTVGGRTYCKDKNGNALTGWQIIDGKKYYFKKNGEMAKKSISIDGVRYKIGSDGVCTGRFTGWTSSSSGRRFYNNGVIKTGWAKISGKKYYFSEPYGFMITGDLIENGYVYHFDENGVWDGSKIPYSEYKKQQDAKRPATVGELLQSGYVTGAEKIDMRPANKSKFAVLNDADGFLQLLAKSSDVKLRYIAVSDEIDVSDLVAYSGDDDMLVRFLGKDGRTRGGWYFSKDDSDNGYIYSLAGWFGAELEGSEVYDMLKKEYEKK